MQAISTRYAGCYFRSRLEARWAVAFDSLGIRWEYERQGYVCLPRLSNWFNRTKDAISYLPDFWFPDFELHGEVKGVLTDAELLRLLDVAASLSSNDGAGCHDSGGNDLIVFGNIPAYSPYGSHRLPTQLHMHKGDLIAFPWSGRSGHCIGYGLGKTIAQDTGGDLADIIVADDYENGTITPARLAQWLTRGSWCWDGGLQAERFEEWKTNGVNLEQWQTAYNRARSARFEHGAQG